MEPARGLCADQLTEDDLEFLLLLGRQGRRALRRVLQLPGGRPAAQQSEDSASGSGAQAELNLLHAAPASADARRAVLERIRTTPLASQARSSSRSRSRSRVRQKLSTAAQLQATLRRNGLRVLWHEHLPERLRVIPDPPWALYARGDTDALTHPGIAIVGARAATIRACRWTQQLAADLANATLCVVSGLALGIDAAAHKGSLQAGCTPTIAVLGSGVDQPTPRQHTRLAAAITAAGGLLLSEYAPGQNARPYHFPERNRLVSGLALGLVVVEAGERSGSLITARLALEQGRELMAVPGPVGLSNSAGCHRLLRQGATLVTSGAEVLEAIGYTAPYVSVAVVPVSPDFNQCFASTDVQLAQQLYLTCEAVAQPLSVLVAAVQGEPSRVAQCLTLLELHGFLKRSGSGYYRDS